MTKEETKELTLQRGRQSSSDKQEPVIPPDELGQLLAETNFTKREIMDFYRYANVSGNCGTLKGTVNFPILNW